MVNLVLPPGAGTFIIRNEIGMIAWKSISLQWTEGQSLLNKAEVDMTGIGIEKLLNLHNSYSASQSVSHY